MVIFRYRTSEANQHRHNAAAGKADPPQHLIHHKSYPGDISAVLQQAQEQEQQHNQRKEADHAADTLKEALKHQPLYYFVYMGGFHRRSGTIRQEIYPALQQVLQEWPDQEESQEEDEAHDGNK